MKDPITSVQDLHQEATITAAIFTVLTTIAVTLPINATYTTKAKFHWSEVFYLPRIAVSLVNM